MSRTERLERRLELLERNPKRRFWPFYQTEFQAAGMRDAMRAERHGRPHRVVIDGSQTNREAIVSCDATSRLQDHRRIKRRMRSMLGFKSEVTAALILEGIEMIHMMRKRQARYAYNPSPSIAEQFTILAA